MNNKNDWSSTPNPNGTPNQSENSQLQWVVQSIAELKASNAKSQEDLMKMLSELHGKIETTQATISTKIVENNRLFEEKIELRHTLLEEKIKGVSSGIENKHALACEAMKNIEPSIINKINSEQKTSNRWIIGILATVALGVGGILIRVFTR